ncbi:hypothetical protein UC8_01400 [Roseimaritima ulvae]|uniref:Uncharacterized protein n=1 Tax=Roseimaritima ulvae TaxID=980254 RepID=A0A5B9QGI6_9BACT|nr:hypothetical protein [Roseimaritima ulvae]QEG38187.1 hypothetical protein UC8_01400 [Roseimaritima ulvae]
MITTTALLTLSTLPIAATTLPTTFALPTATTLPTAPLTAAATNDEFRRTKSAVFVCVQFHQSSNRIIDLLCRQIAVAVSIKQSEQSAAASTTLSAASTFLPLSTILATALLTLSTTLALPATLLTCTTFLLLVLLGKNQVRAG